MEDKIEEKEQKHQWQIPLKLEKLAEKKTTYMHEPRDKEVNWTQKSTTSLNCCDRDQSLLGRNMEKTIPPDLNAVLDKMEEDIRLDFNDKEEEEEVETAEEDAEAEREEEEE